MLRARSAAPWWRATARRAGPKSRWRSRWPRSHCPGRANMLEEVANGAPVLLLVEDDEAFARTLGRSFERRGYQVLHAPGYEEAVDILKDHDPGYAVVDLKLKGNS